MDTSRALSDHRQEKYTIPRSRGQREKRTILTESTPSLIFYYLNSVLDAYKYRLSLETLSVKLYRHSRLWAIGHGWDTYPACAACDGYALLLPALTLHMGLALIIIGNNDDVIFLYPHWKTEREKEIAPEKYCPTPIVCILFMPVTYSADADI